MHALIIGCGYLGRRVGALWISKGHQVSALTRSPSNAAILRELGIVPIVGDVLEPQSLQNLPVADVVLYAVGYDRHAGFAKRDVSVRGLELVLGEISPRVGRFLYVSSTSVYGQDAGEWVDEGSTCVPSSDDGAICLAAEQIVWRFFPRAPASEPPVPRDLVTPAAQAKNATVLRFSGIYGPGRLLRRVESVRRREPIRANPDGFLNLIHVDDGARTIVHLAALERPEAVYLVTDGEPVRRKDYYMRLADLVGAAPPDFSVEPSDIERLNKRCSNRRLLASLGDVLQFPTYREGLLHALTSGSAVPPPPPPPAPPPPPPAPPPLPS